MQEADQKQLLWVLVNAIGGGSQHVSDDNSAEDLFPEARLSDRRRREESSTPT